MNPHMAQLQLMHSMGYTPVLNAAFKTDIKDVVYECFSGKRAEYLTRYVIANARRAYRVNAAVIVMKSRSDTDH